MPCRLGSSGISKPDMDRLGYSIPARAGCGSPGGLLEIFGNLQEPLVGDGPQVSAFMAPWIKPWSLLVTSPWR